MPRERFLSAAALVLTIASSRGARADGWVVAEVPAAIAVSETQSRVFRVGAMPAIGVYTEKHGWFALGLRARAGALRNSSTAPAERDDPGVGGLTTASVALRLSARSTWIELAAGGGITGRDLVPAFEVGIGWNLWAGKVEIGPSVRYVRVVSHDRMAAFGSADLALFGVDVRFGKGRSRTLAPPVVEVAAIAAPVAPPVVVVEPPPEAPRPPPPAVEEPPSEIVVVDDRISLDDRVLFDFNRARVRTRGRVLLGKLVQMWRDHPEWRHITIEGHTDTRGDATYNRWLGAERARRVRSVMLELGVEPDRLSVVGRGSDAPRDPGRSSTAHERNRRVEFVIDRRREERETP